MSTTRTARDEGSALVIAVMSVSVCLALSLVGVQLAMSSTRASGVDRQRVLAINAAEAGVDAGYTAIQNGGANPPCSLPSTSVKSGPDTASFATGITYYSPAGTALPCNSTGRVVGVPAKAMLSSSAQTNVLGGGGTRGSRKMEALVNLIPVQLLNKAIFADGSLSFSNRTTLTGQNGADADVYSNRSVDCANNENFAGNVYSQGDISISNSCTFAGNVWAGGRVSTSNGANGSIGGFVKAGGGSINLTGVTVGSNLYAQTTISYSGCSAAGKCFPNSNPGMPPASPFPVIRGDAASLAEWTAAAPDGPGYAQVNYSGACSDLTSAIKNTYARAGVPTLVVTSCQVVLSNEKDIPLSNDLAIFAAGGFAASQQNTFLSNVPGQQRKMHWIVPYTSSITRPCASPSITTDQNFGTGEDVDMFLYSPCNISFSNNSSHIGQIYGGSDVTIKNQFDMEYRPVPVFGVDLSSMPPLSYTPSIVYKRETR